MIATTTELTAVLTTAEDGGFVALNPETGTTTQGETIEEAVANLAEASALCLSEFSADACVVPLHKELKTGTSPGLVRDASQA